MNEGAFYPKDKFDKEFREALLQSGVHSSRQVVDLVTNLIENSDYIPRDSNLFPVVGYIRARLMANDISLNWLTGVDLKQEIKKEGEEIVLEMELENRFRYLCQNNGIKVYNKVPELYLFDFSVLDVKIKVMFFQSVIEELRRLSAEGEKLTVGDVVGMDVYCSRSKSGGMEFLTFLHWRTEKNDVTLSAPEEIDFDNMNHTQW